MVKDNSNRVVERIISGAVVCAFILMVLILYFGDETPQWQVIQSQYKENNREFTNEVITTVVIGGEITKEKCRTCHIASAGYEPQNSNIAFKEHPDVYHDVEKFSCVSCHSGNPHWLGLCQESKFGISPPVKGEFAWGSCIHCHGKDVAEQYPSVKEAINILQKGFTDYGCLGCHSLGTVGSDLAPNLTTVGNRSLGEIKKYQNNYDKIYGTLNDSVLESIMPVITLPKKDKEYIATFLQTQQSKTGKIFWDSSKIRSGELLYKIYCIGCHKENGIGTGKDGNVSAVPALGSKLFASFTSKTYIKSRIANGRPGTYMNGFSSTLTTTEIDSLVQYIKSGNLGGNEGISQRKILNSCNACHGSNFSTVDTISKLAIFYNHHWDFSYEEAIKLENNSSSLDKTRGEKLYKSICLHCHKSEHSMESTAPSLDNIFEDSTFTDGLFLVNFVVGRGDAPDTRWRHHGIEYGEYSIHDLAEIIYFLRSEK